jgi:hypothetical protein
LNQATHAAADADADADIQTQARLGSANKSGLNRI